MIGKVKNGKLNQLEIPCPIVEGDDPHTAMGKAPKARYTFLCWTVILFPAPMRLHKTGTATIFFTLTTNMIFLINLQKKGLKQVFNNPPQLKRESMYAGSLSEKTESFLQQLRTERNPMTVAEET